MTDSRSSLRPLVRLIKQSPLVLPAAAALVKLPMLDLLCLGPLTRVAAQVAVGCLGVAECVYAQQSSANSGTGMHRRKGPGRGAWDPLLVSGVLMALYMALVLAYTQRSCA